jgi:hypothetical protein
MSLDNDLFNNVDELKALSHQTINTNTTTAGDIIDTKGFGSIVWVLLSATITDGVYTVKLEDGDDSGLSDAADVDATLLLGSLPALILTDDNAVKRVGCISKKRYVRLSLVSTGVTTGGAMGAVALLGHPSVAPVAQ